MQRKKQEGCHEHGDRWAVNKPNGAKKKRSDGGTPKDRYATLIESLVQEEIRQREKALLFQWRLELNAQRPASG